jgi:hypothetical protein
LGLFVVLLGMAPAKSLAQLDPVFTAITYNNSQINLAATANANNNNIVVVYNLSGTFTAPTPGAPTAVGTILAGSNGTIV